MLSLVYLTAAFALSAHAIPLASPSQYAAPASASPFAFPLSNGFPNIQLPSAALTAIEAQAHGTLPNSPLPKNISDTSTGVLQLIAAQEIFEVAYFTSLISNITDNVPGYSIGSDAARNKVLDALIAIQAQEELHAIGVNAILATAGRITIQPCQYQFPVSNFLDAIELASTFTDVVLGTLQEALLDFALDGDAADFTKLLSSVVGQEGEQNGFFRVLSPEMLIPSALPFLTGSDAIFAFSALNQIFIVPGSCPNINIIPVPVLSPLSVDTQGISNATTSIDFSFTGNTTSTSGLSLVYINQQNLPVVETLQGISVNGEVVSFSANFPYSQFEMNGLTIAAVTNNPGPFANASEVAAAAIYGPGLIEIN